MIGPLFFNGKKPGIPRLFVFQLSIFTLCLNDERFFDGGLMAINWFDTKEIEIFAVSLGNDFCQRLPISVAKESTRDANRLIDAATQVVLARVDKFVKNKKFNFYKKACFGNKFKWHLKDAGYPDAVVDPIVLLVVKRFSGALPSGK